MEEMMLIRRQPTPPPKKKNMEIYGMLKKIGQANVQGTFQIYNQQLECIFKSWELNVLVILQVPSNTGADLCLQLHRYFNVELTEGNAVFKFNSSKAYKIFWKNTVTSNSPF